MMKKILIWDTFPLQNTGGPMGYLYNIHEYLKLYPTDQITFLSDVMIEKFGDAEWFHPVYSSTNSRNRFTQICYQLRKAYRMCLKPFWQVEYKVPKEINIDQYDYVHIHIITHVSQFRKLFPHYKGKVILTIHCPCTWTDEILSYTASEKSKLYKITKHLRPIILREECKAYKSADYIMFPCQGAREPYEKTPQVKQVFTECNSKFFYVPSAIVDYKPDVKAIQHYSDFGIPKDAFVITYFGRHIAVKGYDILCDVGVELLNKIPNLYILCAGKGEIEKPNHARWIELGFINNVDDLLAQSNLYILPNRETYFDLITLQILRAGVPLLLSTTGGNNYFRELSNEQTKGLRYFDINNRNQIVEETIALIDLYTHHSDAYTEMGKANRRLYETQFTMNKYVERYIQSIDSLS